MVDFSALKKSKGSNLSRLTKAVEALNSTDRKDDSNEYWKCELDKSGNGYAIIRFLPISPQDQGADSLEWVKYWDHGFQGPGGWYIEKNLNSIGQEDPCSKLNSDLWARGDDASKAQASVQKRRLHYVSNVYIVKDTKNPHNEGQVFKYVYGKKIFEKLTQAMNPQFEDEKPIDPFDLWEGANFKLKVRKVDGYINYDLSEFDSSSPLFEDDEKLEKVWKSQYSLQEIIDPKNFKDYATLDARLKRVLGQAAPTKFKTAEDYTAKSVEDVEDEEFIQKTVEKKSTAPFTKPAVVEDDEDDLSYFTNLLED